MKAFLKFIRSLWLFNFPVRIFVRASTNHASAVRRFFTLHWPVTGKINFRLPQQVQVKMFSAGDDYITTQIFWNGYTGYEGPSIHLFYHLAKKTTAIIDIGANIGYFSLVAAASNTNASIHAFEPVPRINRRMKMNIELNGYNHMKAVEAAVGDKNEMITFFIPKTTGMALAGSTKKGWAEEAEEVHVQSVTMDDYALKNIQSRIGLIKMDCEFHETEVLAGMQRILKEHQPIILAEVLFPESEGVKGHFENDLHLKMGAMLREHGYHFYLINSTALIRVDELEYNPDDRNYLFSVKRSAKSYLPYSDMNDLLNNIL